MIDFSKSVVASLPSLNLTDEESDLVREIDASHSYELADLRTSQQWYLEQYVVQNLRISVPESLEWLMAVLGWPALAVDPFVDRLHLDSFRISDADDGDRDLNDALEANGFEEAQTMAFTDALSMGRGWWVTGSPRESGGAPAVTAESPLTMHALWDPYRDIARAAKQEYRDADNVRRAAILLPKRTLHMHVNSRGQWQLDERDDHGYDFVPVERMAHAPLTTKRGGRSAITPAMRSLTSEAVRTLLALVPARELYSVPGLLLLGASSEAFQKSDGTAKTAWETFTSTVNAIERDENGELPTVFQKQAYDPSAFTKVLDWYASAMAGAVLALPQELGLYTQGNPTSADSLLASDSARNRRTRRIQRTFTPALIRTAQNVMRFMNKGSLPEQYQNLSADWEPPETLAPSLMSDAVVKDISSGMLPAESDVALKKAGYSEVERRRIAADRRADTGRKLGASLASALTGATSGSPVAAPESV